MVSTLLIVSNINNFALVTIEVFSRGPAFRAGFATPTLVCTELYQQFYLSSRVNIFKRTIDSMTDFRGHVSITILLIFDRLSQRNYTIDGICTIDTIDIQHHLILTVDSIIKGQQGGSEWVKKRNSAMGKFKRYGSLV